MSIDQLVYPLFVQEGTNLRNEIPSMPGQYRLSIDRFIEELGSVTELGIPAIILFGIPEDGSKDAEGRAGFDPDGIVCRALRRAREQFPDLLLIADVCLCEYTDHGHCGIISEKGGTRVIDNDATLDLLSKAAVAYADAGADIVAPSDMMDGRIAALRQALDTNGFETLPILSYAAKYASAYYGPFREAAESTPQFGDRRSYQMDPRNAREAIKEVEMDIAEGADIVMVKPATPYLDVISAVRKQVDVPVAAYQVSGEYSALCAAFERGWLDRERTVTETLLGIRRAGADFILTYFAKEVAQLIREGRKSD